MSDPSPPFLTTLLRLEPRAAPAPAAIVAAWLFVEFTRAPVDISVADAAIVVSGPSTHGDAVRHRMRALLSERRFDGWTMADG